MPGLARKILIFAGVEGLILQPLAQQKGQRPASATKIAYNDHHIGPVLKDGVEGESESEGSGKSFEAFGIVVSKSSFLISITRRQQVALIQGKPIFCITEVAITPLASRAEATASITHTQTSLQGKVADNHATDDSDTDAEEGEISAAVGDDVDDEELPPAVVDSTPAEHKRTSSVAEDVISRKGGYGRFAKKWFSKKGWTADQRRNLGMTAATSDVDDPSTSLVPVSKSAVAENIVSPNPRDLKPKDSAASLLPKLLRTTQILFGSSQSFYYSYDYDITRSILNRRPTNSEIPLHAQVDPLYFWNKHIMQPFINAGQSSFVLPLMQGFVGQQEFEMDTDPPKPALALDGAEKSSMEMVDMAINHGLQETVQVPDTDRSSDRLKDPQTIRSSSMKSYLITLISRRSVQRAGLRYLRRGVDDEGHTANGVETEQILSDPKWNPSNKIHSFVQIRGSIPVFFSQSPYSFKPIPQIQHSIETNYQALVKHFNNISDRYGSVQVASLVEKHGPEAVVGEQYAKLVARLNESGGIKGSPLAFEWFDFHSACRGMKFENVSLLIDTLAEQLDEFGYTVELDGAQLSVQSGVLRTNCMDCLDRTNVVQNSFGKRALELQLKTEGIELGLQQDQTTQWFNTLWADNGDAISKQYASTAALKGDFTRTRKRDYKGALTDMGLSISRFYSGIVNDYFSQAAIDFLLGNVTSLVFEDFETSMMSRDPAVSMQKMRQQAIEICQKLVVADEHEEFVGGWTLLTPHVPNTIKSMPFEESILLLTDSGLYSCRFDWNLEKVSSFERVSLEHVIGIKYGTYITSTLSASQADEQRNFGFIVTYKAGANDITRVNTRSMSSVSRTDTDLPEGTSTPRPTSFADILENSRPTTTTNRLLAWKALPSRDAVAEGTESRMTEIEQVKTICSEIERMVLHGQVLEVGTERKSLVESGDIISLAEARKSTGLLEQLGHGLKKLIWA
ncbi:Phosphatidylinositide phosphatase [Lachnellula occidentalis]|uniref:Phosphatidylinositide phosphatase n=1 Tax=Lachnellula occidentalis TaxID=215460 RepID=A0A8H8UIB0_9HELO|nr:Phosphatidylinositide phosphatase [Lachnellula occidentalis]